MIFRSQPGFELLLEKELRTHGISASEIGSGWLRAAPPPPALPDLCFAHSVLIDPTDITGESVNALATRILDIFLESARTERFEGNWPCLFEAAAGLDGLGRRVDAVGKAFGELLRKRMGRVARLASPDKPRGITGASGARGLFVFLTDFQKAHVARTAHFNGQHRMADDPLAPSRSYLKIEEAYAVLGREPAADETVVDLGAAPGGWSYSAAKRGARVIAIDNGPLKGGALDHPLITHLREDAFGWRPQKTDTTGGVADWMFCDLVDDPYHVMRNLVTPWLEGGWCRRFVVILKFGRTDPIALLRELRAADSPFVRHAPGFRIRHLYHDREEFTITGEVQTMIHHKGTEAQRTKLEAK
ncbi:SAM-dependent methyltransferase [Geminisphaera colitermitum]|uniref:SAM-dependent methyltransferase n=1 Tax=Geminisphaera colitermitum TaxID=1148786 RepID=UPI0006938752|nr:SAM-dependent methyltransferase [Geminisphaera colitermitum]